MLLDVAAQLKRSAHAALGLVTNCAVYQLQANGRTGLLFGRLKTVTSQMAIPGAESAVYDCLVLISSIIHSNAKNWEYNSMADLCRIWHDDAERVSSVSAVHYLGYF